MFVLSACDSYHELVNPELLDGKGGFFERFGEIELYASGRDALRSVLPELGRKSKRIFLPNYICPSMPKFFAPHFEILEFKDSPLRLAPEFAERPRGGDIVFAANYFGNFNAEFWRRFKSETPAAILIEDHTLAPFSKEALESRADIVFASLRKVLPLPDGAYLKLRGRAPRPLALRPTKDCAEFAALALQAMALKSACLGGLDIDERIYRKLFLSAEEKLFHKRLASRISAYSYEILKALNLDKFLASAERAVEEFFNSPKAAKLPKFAKISPPRCDAAFAPIMEFESAQSLEEARLSLLTKHNRPASFWRNKDFLFF